MRSFNVIVVIIVIITIAVHRFVWAWGEVGLQQLSFNLFLCAGAHIVNLLLCDMANGYFIFSSSNIEY